MEELGSKIVELVTQLQNVAPQVWEIAMRQVVVEQNVAMAWCLVFFVLTVVVLGLLIGAVRTDWSHDEEKEGCVIFLAACVGVFLFVVFHLGLRAWARSVNPAWYAIDLLLGKVR